MDLGSFHEFGEVYETLDSVDRLEVLLGRLKRQHLLSDEDAARSLQRLEDIREILELHLNSSSLTPQGPRL